MNKLASLLIFLWLLQCTCVCAQSQPDTARDFHSDSLWLNDSLLKSNAEIEKIQKELEESRLVQMNLMMEIEQMKMANIVADSLKLVQQKAVIDSLRKITTGIPVIVEEDTLFYIYANRGGLTQTERANQVSATIERIGQEYGVNPDSVFVLSEEFTSDVMYKNTVIISWTDKDGIWMDMPREELASHTQNIIIQELYELQSRHSLLRLIKRIFLLVLVIAIQIGLIWLTNFVYRRLKVVLHKSRSKFMKSLYIRDYEFLSVDRQERVLLFFLNVLRWIAIILQLIFSIPLLFSIFPYTEDLAMKLFSYILIPIKSMGRSIVDYVPNVFSIIIIWVVIKYIIKGIGYLASEVESERLKIPGFYADWAQPTYSIIRFLLYAFMIVLIYPLLPKSDSQVFQGISVFVGLIVSFGSSAAIGNIISGIIITYMRPFKIGDRIKIQDTIGNVIERTPIVTRIRTLKNEIITIPNSTIMNSQTTNLSESARTIGLIIHLEVTLSYDTPWRQVHDLLIEAALQTKGVMEKPHPFVLETAFNDFYITYQINAYINDADQLSPFTTALRQSIQDVFKQAGLSIMSPHYYVQRSE